MEIITSNVILTKYTKSEPKELWVPDLVSDEFKSMNLDDSENHQDTLNNNDKFKTSIGTLISYNGEYYVIACYHGIQNNTAIYMFVKLDENNDNEIITCKMKELYSIKQYDFSVLEFVGNKDIFEKIKINYKNNPNKLKMKIKFMKNLKDFKIHYLTNRDDNSKIEKKIICCVNVGYTISKIRSELYPGIPVIEIKITDILHEISHEGLSGSLLINENKVYGIISYYDIIKNNFVVIPSYCLKLFLTMSLTLDKIKSFCISTKICNFLDNKIGHKIMKGYNVIYKTDQYKDVKFKNYDIIYSVNDKLFNDDGDLYFDRINSYVPLDTYLLLENSKYYKIKYFTCQKNKENYTELEKIIYPVQIENYMKFDFEYHQKIIKHKGLVITEMSEQLLSYYDKLGIKIAGHIDDHYNDCYTATNQKIVVIMNIELDNVSPEIAEIYKLIGLPLIEDNNKHYIPIISKINDEKVNNLEETERKILASNSSSISIRLEFLPSKYITLKYDDNNHIIIK